MEIMIIKLYTYSIICLTKPLYGFIVARILVGKLIAWKTKHLKTLFLIVLIQFFEARELRCKTTLAGRIHNKQNFAFIAI